MPWTRRTLKRIPPCAGGSPISDAVASARGNGRIGETKVVRKRGERMPKNVWSDVVRYAAEECSEQVREITRVEFASRRRHKEQITCCTNVLQHLNRPMR